MKTRSIPEDTALVSESDVSDDEWKRAATAHERFKRLLKQSRKRKLASTLYLLRSTAAKPHYEDSEKRDR